MELTETYPVSTVCQALNLPRSSYYYRSQRGSEAELRAALLGEAETWPTYGYRRITQELRRKGWVVNGKRVRRLMREMGLQVKKKTWSRRTTDSRHEFGRFPNLIRELEINQPDHVWAADITYVRLRREFVYLALILDLFTRSVRGWHLSRSLDHQLALIALEKALAKGNPQIHHSDQGVQYAALPYVKRLQKAKVKISMAGIGQPTQNPHVERLIRTIKEEEVDLSEYLDYRDAYHQIGRFIEDVYIRRRIHSSLDYLTPAEFEAQWLIRQSVDVI
jgi:transposase InsO family protein